MKTTAVHSPVNTEKRQSIDLRAGDTVRVYQKIQEKGKTRLQLFEGLVLARKGGNQAGATFTVRRVIDGIGVEKTFPLYSPMMDKVEVVKRSRVRRAKLYYIREKAAKEIRKQMRSTRELGAATSTGSDMEDKDRVKKEAEATAAEEARIAAEMQAQKEAEEKVAAEAASKAEEATAAAAEEMPLEEVAAEAGEKEEVK